MKPNNPATRQCSCLYVASVGATPPASTPRQSWRQLQEVLRDTTLPADWRDRLLASVVKCGSQRMVQRLLQMGESPNVLKQGEISPLMTATKEGEFEIMRMLMKAGADPNYKVDGRTAAHQALEDGNELGFHLLVEGGLDLKRESQVRNEENLLFAAMDGGVSLEFEYLIDAGFNPDLPRSGGLMPLQLAADQLRAEAIDWHHRCRRESMSARLSGAPASGDLSTTISRAFPDAPRSGAVQAHTVQVTERSFGRLAPNRVEVTKSRCVQECERM